MSERKLLPTCEYGVPDGYGDVTPCGKAAFAFWSWGPDDTLYVCENHDALVSEETAEVA